jgi:hypothetical protein
MRGQSTKTTGHDIHSLDHYLDMEILCLTIGKIIHITIIYGDDGMIILMDGDD